MKQTRVVTESWSIPFFPFWDLFSSALCLRVNYNTSRCFSCFTWQKKKGGEKRGREGLSERSYCTGWSQMMLCHHDRFSPFYPADRNPQERKSWRISVFQTHAFSIVLCVTVLVYLLLPGFGNVNFWDVQEDIVAIYQVEWRGRGKRGTDQGRFIKMKRVWRRIMRAYDLATQIKKT